MVVSNIFGILTPIPGEMIPFDEHIFQQGWFNHQLGMCGKLIPQGPNIAFPFWWMQLMHLGGFRGFCGSADLKWDSLVLKKLVNV